MEDISGKSEDLQRKVLNTLRQFFTTARQNGLVQSDPTDGVKITPHARPKKKEYLTLEEQEALISALKSLDDRRPLCFVGLCLYCGLRREEALGLQWGDIQGDKLTVNRAPTFLKNNQPDPIQELKSKASHRTIPIPQQLQAILATTPHNRLHSVGCGIKWYRFPLARFAPISCGTATVQICTGQASTLRLPSILWATPPSR